MSELAEALGDIRALRQRVATLEAREGAQRGLLRALSDVVLPSPRHWAALDGAIIEMNAVHPVRDEPAPAVHEPERADACERALDAYAKSLNLGLYPAEKAAFRAGYAATAERDAELRAKLRGANTWGMPPQAREWLHEALRLLDGGQS